MGKDLLFIWCLRVGDVDFDGVGFACASTTFREVVIVAVILQSELDYYRIIHLHLQSPFLICHRREFIEHQKGIPIHDSSAHQHSTSIPLFVPLAHSCSHVLIGTSQEHQGDIHVHDSSSD